ncbi:MAG TPA: CsbD family protein [Burkholderiales bacterium]|nr:CsbD family protein [Burkholderiales bacterium]
MNRHHVKRTMKQVAGKAQEKMGRATGSASHQIKGLGKQVTGKVQKAFGDAQDDADRAQRGRR